MQNIFLNYTVIDLSVTVSENLPTTWPGHFPYIHKKWKDFDDPSNYETNIIMMDEHCGTHIDAASHFIPNGDSGEKINLMELSGSVAVIDVRTLSDKVKKGESPFITTDFLKNWESKHGSFEKGEIILFFTGWDKYYLPGENGYNYLIRPVNERTTPGWPAPDLASILYLHHKGIVTIGIDAPSMGSVQNGALIHKEGLSLGFHYIEGLTNLEQLPYRGAFFIFLPLKIAGATGCPGRAIALVSE